MDIKSNPSGHRWLVFLSSFAIMTLHIGFVFSFGNLFVDIMTTFNVPRAQASLVESIMFAVSYGMGIVNGAIIQRFGPFLSDFIAGILTSVGLISSFFATSISFLIVSVGIVAALGLSCLYIALSVVTGKHFSDKRRPLFVSAPNVGSGVGSIVYPYFLRFLMQGFHYGLCGTFLIVGSLLLNAAPLMLLWRTPKNLKARTDGSRVPGNENKDERPVKMEIHAIGEHALDNNAFSDDVKANSYEREMPNTALDGDIKMHGYDSVASMIKNAKSSVSSQNESENKTVGNTGNTIKRETCQVTVNNRGTDSDEIGQVEAKMPGTCHAVLEVLRNPPFVLTMIGMALSYQLVSVVLIFLVDIFLDACYTANDAAMGFLVLNIFAVFCRILPGLLLQYQRSRLRALVACARVVRVRPCGTALVPRIAPLSPLSAHGASRSHAVLAHYACLTRRCRRICVCSEYNFKSLQQIFSAVAQPYNVGPYFISMLSFISITSL